MILQAKKVCMSKVDYNSNIDYTYLFSLNTLVPPPVSRLPLSLSQC